jgi:integrase
MATAKEDGAVRHNPVTGVRYVPAHDAPPPRKLRPLTLAELDRFMKALPQEWTLFFVVLAHSGLRVSELLGLRWAGVHLADDPHLTITEQVYEGRRKGLKSANAYRRIPLSPDLARALGDWRSSADCADDEDPVFASSVGTPLSYSNVWNRVLDPARKAAGIDSREVGAFHAFRRTLASVVHQSGEKTDRQICDWLGHHDPKFTMKTYVGTIDEGVGDAAFLDKLIPVQVASDAANGAGEST